MLFIKSPTRLGVGSDLRFSRRAQRYPLKVMKLYIHQGPFKLWFFGIKGPFFLIFIPF